jgi:hypothetical protein
MQGFCVDDIRQPIVGPDTRLLRNHEFRDIKLGVVLATNPKRDTFAAQIASFTKMAIGTLQELAWYGHSTDGGKTIHGSGSSWTPVQEKCITKL